MQAPQDIEARFGAEAAAAVAPRIGTPPTGDPTQSPASQDRIRGSLVGAAIGEALGEPQALAREMVLTDAAGEIRIGTAGRFADEPARPTLTVPALGEHQTIYADRIPAALNED